MTLYTFFLEHNAIRIQDYNVTENQVYNEQWEFQAIIPLSKLYCCYRANVDVSNSYELQNKI